MTQFRHQLKILTDILGYIGKWFGASVTLLLFGLVVYRVLNTASIQIGSIVVPKDLEGRGYTSQAVGELLRDQLDKIVRPAQTSAKKEQFTSITDASLEDIEVPKTDLSFHSVVAFLQDVTGLQPTQVTGEITEATGGALTGTISIAHSRRPSSDPVSERTDVYQDPDLLISEMAHKTLELVDPYVLAVDAYDRHDRREMLRFISKCNGRLAKWAWVLWGDALQDDGRSEAAIGKYEMALKLDPTFSFAYYNLGDALQDEHNYEGSIGSYEEAIALDPDNADAYVALGDALQDKPDHDYDGAIENYRSAIDLDRNDDYALYRLANALEEKPEHDYEDAIEAYREAINLNTKYGDAFDDLAIVIGKDAQLQGAVTTFVRRAKNDPYDWTAHYVLGLVEIRLGDRKTGISELRRSNQLEPDNAFILAQIQKAGN